MHRLVKQSKIYLCGFPCFNIFFLKMNFYMSLGWVTLESLFSRSLKYCVLYLVKMTRGLKCELAVLFPNPLLKQQLDKIDLFLCKR